MELFRRAKLETMDPANLDEYGAGIYATWYTQNPLNRPDRDKICNFNELAGEEDLEPIVYDRKSAGEAFGSPQLGEKAKPKRSPQKLQGVRFTAHVHPSEPLEASPDDIAVYRRIDAEFPEEERARMVHFIIDGYRCYKVKR